MKNILFYYYNIYPEMLIKKDKNYTFVTDNTKYLLLSLTRPKEEVKELLLINQEMNAYTHIELNRFQQVITMINEKAYILVKCLFENRLINYSDIINFYSYPFPLERFPILNRSNWSLLWSRKIDYFEYQKSYIEKKYPYLFISLDYYIGYAEVAISYIEEINRSIKKENNDYLTIAHKRTNINDKLEDFYNPLSFVIDYRVRDIAEYLKTMCFGGYKEDEIRRIVLSINSSYSRHLLLARLLFPSFYFDLYEDIVNNITEEKKILKILEQTKDYEDFLLFVYEILEDSGYLIKIDFLERKRRL